MENKDCIQEQSTSMGSNLSLTCINICAVDKSAFYPLPVALKSSFI